MSDLDAEVIGRILNLLLGIQQLLHDTKTASCVIHSASYMLTNSNVQYYSMSTIYEKYKEKIIYLHQNKPIRVILHLVYKQVHTQKQHF